MIMKSRRILAVLAACTAVTFTGCGVVTVVPIGEEASYTGKQEFDSAAESQGDWGAVVADISDKAQDLSELLNGDGITETIAVKGTGKIKEYNTDTPKHYLIVELDGYTGIDPLGIDENVVGKTVTFTGGAEAGTDAVSVTAVELTIE